MEKRKFIIGTYDTAAEGLWTLTAWTLARPALQENYASVPGHSGLLDLSTALTDGEPYYGNRELVATFESSEGSRLDREDRINRMVNSLDGQRLNITLPDDPLHYLTGRVRVEKLYNDLAHASVQVTATCDTWRYNISETVVGLTATNTEQTATLLNYGRLSVVPKITIEGGSVTLITNNGSEENTWNLAPGTYTRANIAYLKAGYTSIRYKGTGQITITYREAVL